MTRYWVGVASREHTKIAIKEGFAQVCHGKIGCLKLMSEGDWMIYYSPTLLFGEKEPCRAFTAIGKVSAGEPYTFAMSNHFIPWRRDISYVPSEDAPILPLLEKLNFIKDKQRWGFPFRRGCFEISQHDFEIIAKAMKVFV